MLEDHLDVWERIDTGQISSTVGRVPRVRIAQGLETALWVCDTNTVTLLPSDVDVTDCVVIPAGESSKAWTQVEAVLTEAVRRGLDRNATFVAFGGGVVCDLAAFAASVYLRGLRVVLIPTSLLAMVDAAVGGKTGINFLGYKNMVGTFHTAAEVRICEDYLLSLSDAEYYSGLAEAIKAAVLGDEELMIRFETEVPRIRDRDLKILTEICRRSVRVKADVVRDDYRERGTRAFLNFGHTFAHALETVAGFGNWTHGAAVAWGMARAVGLGERIGLTPHEHAERIRAVLDVYSYRTGDAGVDVEALMRAMSQDKKRLEGQPRFVLSRGVGDTTVVPVETADLRDELLEAGTRS